MALDEFSQQRGFYYLEKYLFASQAHLDEIVQKYKNVAPNQSCKIIQTDEKSCKVITILILDHHSILKNNTVKKEAVLGFTIRVNLHFLSELVNYYVKVNAHHSRSNSLLRK